MKVENTRVALPRRFQHRAAEYSSVESLLASVTVLVEQSRPRDAPVALVVAASTERMLRDALDETAGLIFLPAPDHRLRRSGQTVVTRRAHELRELTEWAGPVSVITQHDPDQSTLDAAAWAEADAAMNIALDSLPVTMTCFYPESLDPQVGAAARWNHPQILGADGSVRDNPSYRGPAEVLAAFPVAALPPMGPPDRELTFTPWQLTELRAAVTEATEATRLGRDRAEDFVLAVNEVAGNSVEHGYRVGLLQLWLEQGQLVCEVHDGGSLGQPLPGMRAPHPNDPRGRGVWIARQLCDLLHVWSDQDGTHVRMTAQR